MQNNEHPKPKKTKEEEFADFQKKLNREMKKLLCIPMKYHGG